MYFPDLSSYEYGPLAFPCPVAFNVGWLDVSESFSSGPVCEGFLEKLGFMVESPINVTRGAHLCAFCLVEVQSKCGEKMNGMLMVQSVERLGGLGNGEIVVKGEGGVCYFAPVLIYHYVEKHEYQPPDEFVDAVLRGDDNSGNLPE
ncbi:hypothetical protein GCM10027290_39010 [Micromonospora sonneratiae]|uniref:DUF7919 domain-containing protein n=1 Tax=Micromonospora sonneratiae TaxID=1184706 RepID=A0ABW3Y9T6_9ACTN